MKLIILILASDNNEVYLECQKLWRSYMNINTNVKAFFIKSFK